MDTNSVSSSVVQYLKNDLMRQFDSQVDDFMDSLIEESASLEPVPLPAVFSPPLSDKERSKLRCCHDYMCKVFHYVFYKASSFSHFTSPHVGISGLLMARASTLSAAGLS